MIVGDGRAAPVFHADGFVVICLVPASFQIVGQDVNRVLDLRFVTKNPIESFIEKPVVLDIDEEVDDRRDERHHAVTRQLRPPQPFLLAIGCTFDFERQRPLLLQPCLLKCATHPYVAAAGFAA